MRSDRSIALKLRLSGKSYSEISKILGVPKSTLSGWFFNLLLSKELREKINQRGQIKSINALIRGNKNQTILAQARTMSIRKESAQRINSLSQREIFLLGIALYWAEGYKRVIVRHGREVTYHPVSLTNSDPALIKMFLRFLRECCNVSEEKIKISIRIFPNQNLKKLQGFWQKETGIVSKNFGKVYQGISKSSLGKRPFNRLQYGVVQIVVADTQLFHRIMGSIEGIKNFV